MIYYLNIRRGDRHVRDREGSDLPNLQAARVEAIASARELMADAIRSGEDISDSVFEIVEADDGVVASVPFMDAYARPN